MSYPIKYPTPHGANIQIFTPSTNTTDNNNSLTWVKPQGASFVWFTLIGSGGKGGGVTGNSTFTVGGGGGGSGAVTNCMVPAFLIPDILNIRVYQGVTPGDTEVLYKTQGSFYSLLQANSGLNGTNADSTAGTDGSGGAGGTASSAANFFGAAGLFQSVAGQNGGTGSSGSITTSTTTFLSGGPGGQGNSGVGQYGYTKADRAAVDIPGYSLIQPILVSLAANKNRFDTSQADNRKNKSGFGSGGGGMYRIATAASGTTYGSNGGDGMVVIVTW